MRACVGLDLKRSKAMVDMQQGQDLWILDLFAMFDTHTQLHTLCNVPPPTHPTSHHPPTISTVVPLEQEQRQTAEHDDEQDPAPRSFQVSFAIARKSWPDKCGQLL